MQDETYAHNIIAVAMYVIRIILQKINAQEDTFASEIWRWAESDHIN